MGEYRSEDESLVDVARELASAYLEASSDEDAEYAADEIAAFLVEREALPSQALIALLDLPGDRRTEWLLQKVAETLSGRGAEVAGLLLAAMLPDAGTAHRAEHAMAIVDGMDEGKLVAGLVDVLGSRAGDDLKNACVGALIALGEPALHAVEAALDDPVAGPWAGDVLDELRGTRAPGARSQIEALEAAFAAEAYEPTKPAGDGGDARRSGAEGDKDADR